MKILLFALVKAYSSGQKYLFDIIFLLVIFNFNNITVIGPPNEVEVTDINTNEATINWKSVKGNLNLTFTINVAFVLT